MCALSEQEGATGALQQSACPSDNRGMSMLRYTFILVLFLVGCHTTGGDAPQHTSAPGLTLDVEAEPLVIGRGETLHIRLTVTNQGETPVVRTFASGCIYGYSLWNPEGELVAPPPPICTLNAPVVTYAPGESDIREFEWLWDDTQIKPGTYYLKAGLGGRAEIESAPAVEIQLR